ncbi:MAG: PqqD family protein [Deltaproteobacteria bacterium]|nr:PqqD family protein [Deltaproteobacteria bacterium]
MSTNNPLRKENISARKMGEEWMLYNSDDESVHVINSTAEFVWRLCDGSNSLDEIKQEIAKTYNISDSTDLNKDVDAIINQFQELGILNS